jgi:hypothetical protein
MKDSKRLFSFSELVNSNEPSVMSTLTGSMTLVIMGLLLAVNHKWPPLMERGFGVFTIFFVFSICLGVCAVGGALLAFLDPDQRAIGAGGLVIGAAYWVLFYLNITWTHCFNVVGLNSIG